MQGRYRSAAALLILLALPGAAPAQDEVAAARAVFEKNLQAIRDKDRDAYLSCYLQSDGLVRTGPDGFQLGYKGLEATAGEGWPDHISADDLRLTPIRPGVVYGSYRYRVRYGKEEVAGISERLFLETPQGWKIAVSTAFAALPGVPPPPRALVGATLVDGTGAAPVPDSVVILRDGKIDCAGPRSACPLPDQFGGIDTLDLRGHWIAPGLIDAHVHFSQTGWADGRPDSIDVRDRYPYEEVVAGLRSRPERFGRSLLCSGVTAAFDVGGYPWTIALSDRFEPATDVPRVAASGPLLATVDHPLNLPGERQFVVLSDPDSARTGTRYLKAQGADAVKVWFIPSRERSLEEMSAAVRAAGEEARRLGLPLIVHATGLAEAKEALRAGAKLLVHSVDDKPVDQEFLDLAKSAGTVYCPTLTVMSGYLELFGGALRKQAPAFEDPNGCVDADTRSRIAETAQVPPGADLTPEALEGFTRRIEGEKRNAALNLKKVLDAGIPVAMGTDAGNPMTLHGPSVYIEMEAMQAAGLTPMQVLVASTHGGALAMGREKEIGTVEKGKHADLVILAADPTADIANLRKLRWVVRGGALRTIEELSALAK